MQGGSQANFNCGLIYPCQMPQASRFERDQTALSFILVLSYLWRAWGELAGFSGGCSRLRAGTGGGGGTPVTRKSALSPWIAEVRAAQINANLLTANKRIKWKLLKKSILKK